jgi:integrase
MPRDLATWTPIRKGGGLHMRLRADRQKTSYQARLLMPPERRPPKHVTKTFAADDWAEAVVLALEWAAETEDKVKRNEPLKPMAFGSLADEWLAWLQEQHDKSVTDDFGRPLVTDEALRKHRGVVERYLKPFFGEIGVFDIGTRELKEFEGWRANYNVTGPGAQIQVVEYERRNPKTGKVEVVRNPKPRKPTRPKYSTLLKDSAAFNAIIKWASRDRDPRLYFKIAPHLSVSRSRRDRAAAQAGADRRPDFSDQQWAHLLRVAEDGLILLTDERRAEIEKAISEELGEANGKARVKAKDGTWKTTDAAKARARAREQAMARYAATPEIVRQRRLLLLLVQLMGGTGMRTSEALALCWTHIKPDRHAKGRHIIKIGTSFPGLKSVAHARDVVLQPEAEAAPQDLSALYAREGIKLSPEMSLWLQPDGSRVKSMHKAFNGLLARAGLAYDEDGKKRSLSSIRHFYTTALLESGVDDDRVSKAIGSSNTMLQRHYSHVDHMKHAEELRRSLRKPQSIRDLNRIISVVDKVTPEPEASPPPAPDDDQPEAPKRRSAFIVVRKSST